MAGGSEEHSALAAEMIRLLAAAVEARPCRAHTSDLRIHVLAANLSTYPDASVICGPLQRHEPGPETTALNPIVLVEVTSDSSEEYDIGDKRQFYRTIPALREYVIVSHRERRVIIDVRREDGTWSTGTASRGERFDLPSLQATIEVDDVYRKSEIP